MAIEVLGSQLSAFWVNPSGQIEEKEIIPALWAYPHSSECEALFFNDEHKTIWGYRKQPSRIGCFRINQNAIKTPQLFDLSRLIDERSSIEELIFAKVLDNGNLMLFCELKKFGISQFSTVIFESNLHGLVTRHSITQLDELLGIGDLPLDLRFQLCNGNLVMSFSKQINLEEDDEDWETVYKKIVFDGDGTSESMEIDYKEVHFMNNDKVAPLEFELEPIGNATFKPAQNNQHRPNIVVKTGNLEWNVTIAKPPNNLTGVYNVIKTTDPSNSTKLNESGEHSRSLEQRISNLEAAIGDIFAMLENIKKSN